MNKLQPRFAKLSVGLFFAILMIVSVALLLSGVYLLVLGGTGFFALASLVLTAQIATTWLWRNARWIITGLSLISLVAIIGINHRFNQLGSYVFGLATILIPFAMTSIQPANHFYQRLKTIGLAVVLVTSLLILMSLQLQAIQQLKTHYQNTSPKAESWQQYGAL
ncbi:MAG: hypothetical protein EOO68_31950 [Moraxellaceae bacterium]|nr:MAG: hypothetical protein EOO68_31950 [Moraxellaceae bacterium]